MQKYLISQENKKEVEKILAKRGFKAKWENEDWLVSSDKNSDKILGIIGKYILAFTNV